MGPAPCRGAARGRALRRGEPAGETRLVSDLQCLNGTAAEASASPRSRRHLQSASRSLFGAARAAPR